MSLTFPLALPASPPARRLRWRPMVAVGVTQSPFTFQSEIFEHQGQRWVVDVELPPMTVAQAHAWIAWGLALNGPVGTFLMGDPTASAPRGSGAGAPVVDGAGQARTKVLATRGWTADASGVLLAGDLIQLGSGGTAALHRVLADVDADGDGKAEVDIFPRVRRSLTDGESITIDQPVGLWRLDGPVEWDVDLAQVFGLSFRAVEAL